MRTYTIGTGYAINADGTWRCLTPEERARDEKHLRASLDQCKPQVSCGHDDGATTITIFPAPSHAMGGPNGR